MNDREILRESLMGEKAELDQDLADLAKSVSRGDFAAVRVFVRHQPLVAAAVCAPVFGVAVLTRYPPLALGALRVLLSPTTRFFAYMSPVWLGAIPHAISTHIFGVDLTDRFWRSIVERAKRRNERRKHARIRDE